MARRSLSTQGRIIAAGVSIAIGGALVGVMAASDHSADASSSRVPAASSPASSRSADGTAATPYGGRSSDDGNGYVPGGGSVQPQPQTRTGGS